jgi:hypothetical protein
MFFDGIMAVLNESLSGYSIIMTIDYKNLPETQFPKIVLLVCEDGDNNKMPYSDRTDVVAVFRYYAAEWGFDNKKVFPIPIGYNCRSNGKMMQRMYPEKPISERKWDIFYSGQSLPGRVELVKILDTLKSSFNVFSQVTPMFRLGLDIDDYYRALGDSKICVVPDGTSQDTFRYSEAVGSGCIVITTTKPDLWYYKDAAVLFLKDWSLLTEKGVRGLLDNILDVPKEEILEYYNRCLSERAVANYIIKTIQCLTS